MFVTSFEPDTRSITGIELTLIKILLPGVFQEFLHFSRVFSRREIAFQEFPGVVATRHRQSTLRQKLSNSERRMCNWKALVEAPVNP